MQQLPASDPGGWDYQPAIRAAGTTSLRSTGPTRPGAPLGIGQNATWFFLPWHALTVPAMLALPGNLLVMAVLTALVLQTASPKVAGACRSRPRTPRSRWCRRSQRSRLGDIDNSDTAYLLIARAEGQDCVTVTAPLPSPCRRPPVAG
jgi:hypothetical protein